MDDEAFRVHVEKQDAVVRRLEIIGEAVKGIPSDVRAAYLDRGQAGSGTPEGMPGPGSGRPPPSVAGKIIEGAVTTNWMKALARLSLAYPERINPHPHL